MKERLFARSCRLGSLIAIVGALTMGSQASALAASPQPGPSPATTPAKPTPASSSKATFGIGPANATNVDGRPDFRWSATPGGTLQDHVAVVNYSTEPLTLDLYARDALNQSDGGLGMETKAQTPTGVGAWMTLEIPRQTSTLTVPGRSTVIVPVSLEVPLKASPGDHTGGIIVSLNSQAIAKGGGDQTLNPALDQRVAVPVELRVSGPVHPGLTVQGLKASYGQTLNPVGGGHATVTYHIVNTGNVNLGGHEAISISGLFGSTVHAKAPDIPVLLPGGSVTESVPVHGVLPEFLMSARVAVTPLVPKGDVDPGLTATSGSKHFWAVPWLLLGIIALLLLGWRQLRRRKRPSAGRHGTKSGGGTRRRGSASALPARTPAEVSPDGITVTSSFVRLASRVGAVVAAAAFASAIPAGTAFASSLPYTDAYAHGAIGLCDKNGNNITHGSVYDKPFVWRAISSVPAPNAYSGSGQNATLYAFQPRVGVDAANWSGDQLTGTSAYSRDSALPIVQATVRDEALSDHLDAYPPQWDRLVELRIFFGSLAGQESDTYPVADIRVKGTTWSLVYGAKVDCKAGSAISNEAALPSSNPVGMGPPLPLSAIAAKAVGAPVPNAVAAGASADRLSTDQTASESERSKRGWNGGQVVLLGSLSMLAAFTAAGIWYWRRARPRAVHQQ